MDKDNKRAHYQHKILEAEEHMQAWFLAYLTHEAIPKLALGKAKNAKYFTQYRILK